MAILDRLPYTMKKKYIVFDCFKKYHTYSEKLTSARIDSVNVIE